MSDGTHVIRVVNPEDFKTVRTMVVNDESGKPIMKLNELEMVKGEIWANIWQTGWIIRIDPQTGKASRPRRYQQTRGRRKAKEEDSDVLNGIAYDKAGDRIVHHR